MFTHMHRERTRASFLRELDRLLLDPTSRNADEVDFKIKRKCNIKTPSGHITSGTKPSHKPSVSPEYHRFKTCGLKTVSIMNVHSAA